jgi:hypothetical protein
MLSSLGGIAFLKGMATAIDGNWVVVVFRSAERCYMSRDNDRHPILMTPAFTQETGKKGLNENSKNVKKKD